MHLSKAEYTISQTLKYQRQYFNDFTFDILAHYWIELTWPIQVGRDTMNNVYES